MLLLHNMYGYCGAAAQDNWLIAMFDELGLLLLRMRTMFNMIDRLFSSVTQEVVGIKRVPVRYCRCGKLVQGWSKLEHV